jgi:hypothetical protein
MAKENYWILWSEVCLLCKKWIYTEKWDLNSLIFLVRQRFMRINQFS